MVEQAAGMARADGIFQSEELIEWRADSGGRKGYECVRAGR